jgi:hypothetical protein
MKCKGLTKDKKQCRGGASLGGYCIKHYWMAMGQGSHRKREPFKPKATWKLNKF